MPHSEAVVKQSGQKRRRQLILSYSDSEDDEPKVGPGGQQKATGISVVATDVVRFEVIGLKKRALESTAVNSGFDQQKVAQAREIHGRSDNRALERKEVNEKTTAGRKRAFKPSMEEGGADKERGQKKRRRLILNYSSSEEEEPTVVRRGQNKDTGLTSVATKAVSVKVQLEKRVLGGDGGRRALNSGYNQKRVMIIGANCGFESFERMRSREVFVDERRFNSEMEFWKRNELVSRDRKMRLSAHVLLASIDQMSDSAGGESACSALAAVIANWLLTHHGTLPTKSEFDSLVREGSLEWRKLCSNKTYSLLYPNKHFDLETILKAKVRPLTLVSEKSFFAFFQPEAVGDSKVDFFKAFKSFDDIWDEIRQASSDCSADKTPLIYIVSWNDHFFVLKAERNAYYLLDTFGERLYEGCKKAYILKFDESTFIHKFKRESKVRASETVKSGNQHALHKTNGTEEEELVCKGKESCKEYIKSFLAAIPIREAGMKKGQIDTMLLYRSLQIEFHNMKTIDVSERH